MNDGTVVITWFIDMNLLEGSKTEEWRVYVTDLAEHVEQALKHFSVTVVSQISVRRWPPFSVNSRNRLIYVESRYGVRII